MESVPNYFFLNNKLYKKIRVVKTQDYIVAWSFEEEMRMRFNYSSVRREASKAYKLEEVAELIDRPAKDILSSIKRNIVSPPSGRLYNTKSKKPGRHMWSEDDILDLRNDYFDNAPKDKYGDPYINFKLVSRAELLNRMRQDISYYVKNENGDYVKVWKAI